MINRVHSQMEKNKSNDKLPELFFHIFFCILFLVIVPEILWKLTNHILINPNEVTTMSPIVFSVIKYYFYVFDSYSKTLYTVLLSTCVLALYSILDFINNVVKGRKIILSSKFKRMMPILILFLVLCIYALIGPEYKIIILSIVFSTIYVITLYKYVIIKIPSKNRFPILIILFSALIILFLTYILPLPYPFSEFDLYRHILYFLDNLLGVLIISTLGCYMVSDFLGEREFQKKIGEDITNFVRNHPFVFSFIFYSLFLYTIICLFFARFKGLEDAHPFGVLMLYGAAVIISGGIFACGHIIGRVMDKNRKILELLITETAIETEKDGRLVKELQNHLKDLLLDFFIAISGYFLLRAFFGIVLSEQPEISSSFYAFLTYLDANLSVILLIPLHIFLYKASSVIMQDIYGKIYMGFGKKLYIPSNLKRKESFVNVLAILTKVIIFVIIATDVLSRLGMIELAQELILRAPFSYIIQLFIAAWIFFLILNPFFEGETIEIGPNIGRIKNIGIFFAKLETLTGEQIYIPSIELLVRKMKRLNVRETQDESYVEKGITIHFLFEIPIDIESTLVQDKFTKLFNDKNRKGLRRLFDTIGYEITGQELDYIFSPEKSRPFVLIENFKDKEAVYKFNFHVRNAFYASIFRSFFMEKFKEEMGKILRKRWEKH